MMLVTIKKALYVLTAWIICTFPTQAGDIVVGGFGETKITPDTLSFSIYVREKGPLVSKLYVSVNNRIEQILRVLETEKVPPKNIQSMELQVHPWFEYENRNRVQQGFELSRTIEVNLMDTSRLSQMLDYIFRIGNLEIGQFSLGTSEQSNFYQLALKNAMANAQSKAELLAKNGGIKLGEITAIRESSASVARPVAEMKLAEAAGAGQFVPGQISISASVEVTYSITQ